MRINQASNQLKTPPAKINEAIAQLYSQGNPLFPRDRYDEITPEQLDAIRQFLATPQQPQQQATQGATPGSARSVGGAFGVINQDVQQAAAVAGLQMAREAAVTAKATATHALLNYSLDELDQLVLDQLGLAKIDDGSSDVIMGELLGGLGKQRGAILDFSAPNPILAIAGMQQSTQPALSASSESATEQAGEPSSPSA